MKDAIERIVSPTVQQQMGEPKTVSLAQTTDQVEAVLGKLGKVIELSPKRILVYSDMKITFHDGKVTDVQ